MWKKIRKVTKVVFCDQKVLDRERKNIGDENVKDNIRNKRECFKTSHRVQ